MTRLLTSYGFISTFFLLFGCVSMVDDTLYFYTDQNNNTYTISSSEIRYDPVAPKESSSGVYNGGEKAVVVIPEDTFKNIVDLVEALQLDTINHIQQREMRTAILLVEKDGEDVSRIILKSSERRSELEILLEAIVD